MKNRKGFSLVEILAVMVILGILITLGFATYTRYQKKTIEDSYETLKRSASNAAENYFMDHSYSKEVTIQELVDKAYLENCKDPQYDKESCSGKVTRYTNLEGTTGELSEDSYKVVISCKKHKSCAMYPSLFGCDPSGAISTSGDNAYNLGYKNYNFGSQITYVIRVKFNDLSKNHYVEYFGNWEGAGGGLGITADDKFYMNLFNQNQNQYIQFTSNTKAYIDKWYVVVGMLQAGRIKMYVNGQALQNTSGATYVSFPGNIKPSPLPIIIGANPAPDGSNSVGAPITVSDALVFKEALDTSDIQNYFSTPNTGLNYSGSKTPLINQKF